METRQESVILKHLIVNDEYTRKVLPYLKDEYFDNQGEKTVFQVIKNYVAKYNVNPSIQAVEVLLGDLKMSENVKTDVEKVLVNVKRVEPENTEWLINNTEKFCKRHALWNAIITSSDIIAGEDEKKKTALSEDAIPKIIQDALSVCFDPTIGHDYIEDFEKRFDFYHKDIKRIPFDIDILNKITKGGIPSKSLTVFSAGCIHPDTPVIITVDDGQERVVPMKDVKTQLKEGRLVKIFSPDGFVKVNKFIKKGMHQEYCLSLDDGRSVRCNEDHLFETAIGWQFAKDLALIGEGQHFLTEEGYVLGFVQCVEDSEIPIVDIEVDHENHRYYANGVSSHNTGVGKSMVMCHMAAAAMAQSKNVLYISMEMSEEMIAERIDANLFDIDLGRLRELSKESFEQKIMDVQKRSMGKLIIKEYPTSTAHAGHFKTLLNELKLKKKFIPEIIFVDYMNICSSQNYKKGTSSYEYIKSISEELRALAVEYDIPLVTATQLNRGGYGSSDVGLQDTSESFGLNFVADLVLALMSSDELEGLNQMMVKQLKNRHNNPNYHNKFVIGVDRSKMRLFDSEPHATRELVRNRQEDAIESVFKDMTKSHNFSKLKVR